MPEVVGCWRRSSMLGQRAAGLLRLQNKNHPTVCTHQSAMLPSLPHPCNPELSQLGLNPVPCVAEHPVSEALFNFVNAWSLMWWPVMLADPQGRKVNSRFGLW